ncbi:MAG TPA: lipid A biosynthesis acyltransferase [Gammaproteobacteria bacterium]|nr:lipid A biosynthesis acyltransferase [Gammaproteobacteria bacterium]
MRDWLILQSLKLLSRTPLRLNLRLGRWLGALAWRLNVREKRTALTNLALCFPDQPEHWRRAIARESLAQMGAALLEAPRLWRLDAEDIRARLDNLQVLEETLKVYEKNQGLVLAVPHLGSWEFVGQLFGAHTRITSLFRPPRITSITDWVRKARQNTGATLVPTSPAGVRALAKTLAKGDCSGILPDQEPEAGNGVFVPFFGVPAYTMRLLPRLVAKRKIPVLFLFAERLKSGKYHLHAQWADPALYDDNIETACAAMNRRIESLTRICPEQYNWAYKRFKSQPDGRQIY